MASLGTLECCRGALDLGLHATKVGVDRPQLPLRVRDRGLRARLVLAQVAQQRLGACDRDGELLLALPGSFDLIRQTGTEGWRWRRRRDREEDDQGKDEQSWRRQGARA